MQSQGLSDLKLKYETHQARDAMQTKSGYLMFDKTRDMHQKRRIRYRNSSFTCEP